MREKQVIMVYEGLSCGSAQASVANKEVKDHPLMDKLCKLNTHGRCFSLIFSMHWLL